MGTQRRFASNYGLFVLGFEFIPLVSLVSERAKASYIMPGSLYSSTDGETTDEISLLAGNIGGLLAGSLGRSIWGRTTADDMLNPTQSEAPSNFITEYVAVPSSEHVAEIVGRQGCKIKALRQATNTYIKTPFRGKEPVFEISGRKEDVAIAKREILSAAKHFSEIRAARKILPNVATRSMMPPSKTYTINVQTPAEFTTKDWLNANPISAGSGSSSCGYGEGASALASIGSRSGSPISSSGSDSDVFSMMSDNSVFNNMGTYHLSTPTTHLQQQQSQQQLPQPQPQQDLKRASSTASNRWRMSSSDNSMPASDNLPTFEIGNWGPPPESQSTGGNGSGAKPENISSFPISHWGSGMPAASGNTNTQPSAFNASLMPTKNNMTTFTSDGGSSNGSGKTADVSAASTTPFAYNSSSSSGISATCSSSSYCSVPAETATVAPLVSANLLGGSSDPMTNSLATLLSALTNPDMATSISSAASSLSDNFSTGSSTASGSSLSNPSSPTDITALSSTVGGASANSGQRPGVGPCVGPSAPRLCTLCLENSAMAALVPCGHNLFCLKCAHRLSEKRMPCPVCKEQVIQVLAIKY